MVAGLKSQLMNICTDGARVRVGLGMVRQPARTLTMRPALWDWITVHDLEPLRESLVSGSLPSDFVGKLQFLAGGDLSHRFIEHNCRLVAELLLSVEQGTFQDIKPPERERLLRVIAYVRKEDDAIPDRFAGGFADDQREVLAATLELGNLLRAFKAWRLRCQVPLMWTADRVARMHA
jgi:hypothetical protein